MKKIAVLNLYYLPVTGLRWALTLPCLLSAEALVAWQCVLVKLALSVSDSEINTWLQTELRGRERKCIPLGDPVKCMG